MERKCSGDAKLLCCGDRGAAVACPLKAALRRKGCFFQPLLRAKEEIPETQARPSAIPFCKIPLAIRSSYMQGIFDQKRTESQEVSLFFNAFLLPTSPQVW
jgi:hypothetical protein